MAFVLLLSFPNGSARSVPFIITDGAGLVNGACVKGVSKRVGLQYILDNQKKI